MSCEGCLSVCSPRNISRFGWFGSMNIPHAPPYSSRARISGPDRPVHHSGHIPDCERGRMTGSSVSGGGYQEGFLLVTTEDFLSCPNVIVQTTLSGNPEGHRQPEPGMPPSRWDRMYVHSSPRWFFVLCFLSLLIEHVTLWHIPMLSRSATPPAFV